MLPFTLLATMCHAQPAGPTVLGVDGTRFTLNGQPTFLLGISYYGALAAPERFIRADLDDFQAAGINWIRVWATWGFFDQVLAAVDVTGAAQQPYLSRLQHLLTECDRRGMVVDITLIRSGERAGQPTMLADFAAHRRAVETLARELKPWRNAYFDLANERSLPGKDVSYEDLARLREAAKAIDPDRLLTASDAGEIDEAKLRGYVLTARLDLLTPHVGRSTASARRNRERTVGLLGALERLGRMIPVHYQEPFRRGFTRDWEPTVEDFLTDLTGAREGGAAGWCFHNGDQRFAPEGRPRRSFDLREAEGRLMDQLDAVEREVVARMGR